MVGGRRGICLGQLPLYHRLLPVVPLLWLWACLALPRPVSAADPIAVALSSVGQHYGLVVTSQYFNRSVGSSPAPTMSLYLMDVQSLIPGAVTLVPAPDGGSGSGTGSGAGSGAAEDPTSTVVVSSVIVDGARTRLVGPRAVNTTLWVTTTNDVGAAPAGSCPGTPQPATTVTGWNLTQVLPVFAASLQLMGGVVGLFRPATGPGSDGVLVCTVGCGLAVSSRPSPTALSPAVVAFDFPSTMQAFNPLLPSGVMHIGGPSSEYSQAVLWSQRASVSYSDLFSFPMFRVGVCGAEALGNVSTHWVAVVDTASSCLTVPSEVFASFMAWLPMDCTRSPEPLFETALPLQCSLRPGVSATSLPRLYFRLSESGRQLHIALQDLLLTDGATLCLLEGRPVHVATDLMQPSLTRIRLGTLALRSLYTVLDGASKRVGFANKANVPSTDRAGCAAPVACRGAQIRDLARNRCLPPMCDLYYFQQVDDASQTCVYRHKFIGAMLFFLVLAVVSEVVLRVCRVKADAEPAVSGIEPHEGLDTDVSHGGQGPVGTGGASTAVLHQRTRGSRVRNE